MGLDDQIEFPKVSPERNPSEFLCEHDLQPKNIHDDASRVAKPSSPDLLSAEYDVFLLPCVS